MVTPSHCLSKVLLKIKNDSFVASNMTQGKMSRIVFSRIDLAESNNFRK